MAIISFPYDSQLVDGKYDRAIKSATYRQLLSKYFTTGVFPNPSTQCQVYPITGMKVSVRKGSANINGLYVELEEDVEATIEQADTQGRYDRIVLRHDDNNNVRATNVVVIKGTAGASPKAPSLTRNETVYDICLATVYVRAGATSIYASDITDTRLNTDLCGIVLGTIKSVDTTTLYNQIQSDLLEFKTKEKADFEEFTSTQEHAFLTWFENIKGILGEDEAGSLLLLIQENQANIEKLQYTGNIVSGETFSGKASNKGVKLHKVIGKTIQDGVPTPDIEVPIKNVVITEIYSNGEYGTNTDTKTNTVKTSLTLAEGDVFENGVVTRKRKKVVIDENSILIRNTSITPPRFEGSLSNNPNFVKGKSGSGKCNLLKVSLNPLENNSEDESITCYSQGGLYFRIDRFETIEELKEWLKTNPIIYEYDLLTPTTEEIKVPTIPSYYPNTNIWTDNTVSTDIEWELLSANNTSLEIEEVEGNLQKPNLLINADFKNGVINQIGESIITSTNNLKLTIDGWYLRAKSGKLTVNSNSISVESLEDNDSDLELYLNQNIKKVNIGEKYTIFANILDLSGVGKAFICLQDTLGETTKALELKQGENKLTFNADKNYNKLLIYFDGLKKVEISQLKLEEGENFTGMPNFDFASELEKCKVYLLKLNSYADVFSGKSDSSGLVFTIPTTVQMYKDPTQSVKSNIMVFHSGGSKQIVSPNLECQVTPIGIRCILRQNIDINGSVNVVFEGIVLFDANR